jgi:hypothetical protein
MRIESSQVEYLTRHDYASTTVVTDETLPGASIKDAKAGGASTTGVQPTAGDTVQLSQRAESFQADDREDLQGLDPKLRLAVAALEALLGHQIRLKGAHGQAPKSGTATAPAAGGAEVHRRTVLHSEAERLNFQAQGVVDTTDGRSIQFQATLTMQRQFQSSSTTTGSSNTTDPLVLNFGGSSVELTHAKISFDLNSDGKQENVSFVSGGSGFLALDSNGDGTVNDGRELFGPQTGNGFAELASYDADGNGWIDENDPVFSKLQIWTSDGLSTLLEKGVGAIFTASAETPFEIKDANNSTQAEVRRSGIYLSENGGAGTIQQVDLAEG